METTFLSMKEACKQNAAHAELIRAVVQQLGGMNNDTQQMMKDILRHGIDGGFHGFIYYSDTCKFAQKNQQHIAVLLEEQAEQLGEDVVSMVANFGVFRNPPMDDADRKDLHLFLAGQAGRCKGHTILNVLAWFAAEEVCRMFLPEF